MHAGHDVTVRSMYKYVYYRIAEAFTKYTQYISSPYTMYSCTQYPQLHGYIHHQNT